jgi:tRNA U55 pseudouridine synthase TruB
MTLADCHPLEDAERAGREGRLAELMQPMDRALDHLPEVRLTVPRLRRFCSGAEVPPDRERAWGEATVRVYGEDGALYGLGITVGSGALRARSVFRDSGQSPEPTGSVLP